VSMNNDRFLDVNSTNEGFKVINKKIESAGLFFDSDSTELGIRVMFDNVIVSVNITRKDLSDLYNVFDIEKGYVSKLSGEFCRLVLDKNQRVVKIVHIIDDNRSMEL